MRARLLAAFLICSAFTALPAAPAGAAPAQRMKVGTLVLRPCPDGTRWMCGKIRRRLDPARPGGPHIRIGFRWLAAKDGPTGRPPLVAVEGGPGYPSTGTRVEYRGIFGPLLRKRDLLLVDNRGTGTSALIQCRRLQHYTGVSSGPGFPGLVAGCARAIERHYRRPGRPAVHAADLFATAYAVGDFEEVLRRLRLRRIDLYGDSYGTWFVQSYISRHRRRLNSVLLDSAYPVRGLDPWYASSGEVARRAFDAVCERDAGCSAATSGTAVDRLGRLLTRLRQGPITGVTRDSDGTRVHARVDVRAVVDMVQDAASEPNIYRELDASVRAALAGDDVPLLRLVAQTQSYLHGASTADYFSNGLYFAVSCMDYPQLFSMHSTPSQRRRQLAARLLAPPPGAFTPFTAREWFKMSAYSEPYAACLDWPRPAHTAPAVAPKSTPLPASVPLLVVGGDLDSLTPVTDAPLFVPGLGANTRVVTVPNTVHVDSQGYTPLLNGTRCVRRIIRAFVRAPAAMAALDTSCTAGVPPVHTPGAYPLRLGAASRATLVSGPDPGAQARRAATVAAGALADATVRRFYSGAARGPGLRGGSFTARGDGPVRLRLRGSGSCATPRSTDGLLGDPPRAPPPARCR